MTVDLFQLERILKELAPEHQRAGEDYAYYIHQRYKLADSNLDVEVNLPEYVERPQHETVIAVMKRLRNRFPMVNTNKILHEASDLLITHLLQGKTAELVIDKLEILFEAQNKKVSGQ
ncbi:MAG: hypothetical protein ACI845_001389 [Gammaproteobacteria bacterium]|jgi:hypothetical protein